MNRFPTQLLISILVILLFTGCAAAELSSTCPPEELLYLGGLDHLETVSIEYHSDGNKHIAIALPGNMPMEGFYASVTARASDGSTVNLLEGKTLLPDKWLILDDIENYESVVIRLQYEWEGTLLSDRVEEITIE